MNKYLFQTRSVLISLGILLLLVLPVKAQGVIQVKENVAEMSFPDSIAFYLGINSDETIETVKLHYGTDGRSCQDGGSRQILEFEMDTDLELSWEWELKRSGALPPGVEVWWQWEIITTSGASLLSEKKVIIVEDDRHDWQELNSEGVFVQWYVGDREFGDELLDIAITGLNRLEAEIGIRPAGDLRLIIYASAEDVRDALIHTYEWTGGVAMDEYNSTIIGIYPSQMEWARDVIPHELAHLVIGTLTFNCRGARIPTWLNEGIAVLSEGEISPQDFDRLEASLAEGSLPALKSLERGFSADSDRATLSYTQSAVVTDYLIHEFGKVKLSTLLLTIQEGETIDNALESVIGMDTAGLDAAWRNSLGYASETGDQGISDEASPTPTPVPTLALWTPMFEPSPTEAATATPAQTTEIDPSPTPTSRIEDPSPTTVQMDHNPSPSNRTTFIGLGIGGFVIGIIIVYFLFKRKGTKV